MNSRNEFFFESELQREEPSFFQQKLRLSSEVYKV